MTTTIPWENLQQAQGPATRLPATLKKLVGKSEQARVDAFDTLKDGLVGDAQWFSASAPAVDALLAQVAKAPEPDLLLVLAADIVGADHVRGWLEPVQAPAAAILQPVLEAALRHSSLVTAQLVAKNPRARAAAAVLLAVLPSLGVSCLPQLLERAESDEDDVVRASALLAVGKLGAGDARATNVVDAMRSAASPLLRGAATVARLRSDPTCTFAESHSGLLDWLGSQPPLRAGERWLPWFGGLEVGWYAVNQKLEACAHALFSLARAQGREGALLDTSLGLGESETLGREARRLGALVLETSELSRHPKSVVLPFPELRPDAREVARRLANTSLLPTAGHGVPAAGNSRRRWAGSMQPGPLEREVSIELEGRTQVVPFWLAVRELNARKVERAEKGQGPFPAPIAATVSGAERWQAVAELLCLNYGVSCSVADRFDEELAAIELDDGVREAAASVADDWACRVVAAQRDGLPPITNALGSAWVLLPFVRSGAPFAERWDILIEIGKDARCRELFEALPPKRREARLLSYINADWRAMHLTNVFDKALVLLPLAPSTAVVGALLGLIQRHAAEPHHRAPELRAALDALAAKDERIRGALDEATKQ